MLMLSIKLWCGPDSRNGTKTRVQDLELHFLAELRTDQSESRGDQLLDLCVGGVREKKVF